MKESLSLPKILCIRNGNSDLNMWISIFENFPTFESFFSYKEKDGTKVIQQTDMWEGPKKLPKKRNSLSESNNRFTIYIIVYSIYIVGYFNNFKYI